MEFKILCHFSTVISEIPKEIGSTPKASLYAT